MVRCHLDKVISLIDRKGEERLLRKVFVRVNI